MLTFQVLLWCSVMSGLPSFSQVLLSSLEENHPRPYEVRDYSRASVLFFFLTSVHPTLFSLVILFPEREIQTEKQEELSFLFH